MSIFASLILGATVASAMVVVDEARIKRDEPPPHGQIGMSTVSPLTETVAGRTMEFRKRSLHKGAAIGLHVINHDEVYYVVSGAGDVTSDGQTQRLTAGMMAYLYSGANVGIIQTGDAPLTLIISYPVVKP